MERFKNDGQRSDQRKAREELAGRVVYLLEHNPAVDLLKPISEASLRVVPNSIMLARLVEAQARKAVRRGR